MRSSVTRTWVATVVVLSSLIPLALLGAFAFYAHGGLYDGYQGSISALIAMATLVPVLSHREKFFSLNTKRQSGIFVFSLGLLVITYLFVLSTMSGPVK
ncbi:hypothetical protein [Marinobacter arenosus]|uniref:hypothetical protein n=1 Tax=Marinobacter arenosus TaxID=2856822 RepID=UPI001C4BFF9F|nr:hypothetical protein [Marinobacter arenosus]MBW0149032.1 hypothetical protein [Marinobacter arenosus]